MISWSRWKQGSIAHIISEVEYIALSDASKQAVWLRKLVFGLFGDKLETMVVHCDNQSCKKLTDNPIFHDRSKHIDMKYHYIRDMAQRKIVKLQYISMSEQVVDILTKPLPLR
jgi:hypothetical protein